MSVLLLLAKIQPAWIHRVTNAMARGAGVRETFEAQLNRFYDMLAHAMDTGDPAWLDPIVFDWSNSPTSSDLREGQKNILIPMLVAWLTMFFVIERIPQAEQWMVIALCYASAVGVIVYWVISKR